MSDLREKIIAIIHNSDPERAGYGVGRSADAILAAVVEALTSDAAVEAVTRAVGLYLQTSGPDSTLRQRDEPREIAKEAMNAAVSTLGRLP